jgi:TRAP-type mannitol/chloroaromatic compound transport system, periplasmic component
MDYFDYLGWLFEGGGLELWQQLYQKELGLNVHVIPILYAGPQVLGWFNKPIRSLDDMKGLKWRIAGVPGEVWQEFGSSTVQIPGGEILPSAERGVIEGAEWVTPGEDRKMGFQDIWKYYGMPALGEYVTGGELLVNKDLWDSLPSEYQAMMKTAAMDSTIRSWILLNKLNAEAMKALREEDGVTIFRTPQSVLEGFLRTWDEKVGPKYANQNAFFKKVWDSQREYASKLVPARAYIEPDKIWLAQWYFPDGGWVGVNMDELGQRVPK